MKTTPKTIYLLLKAPGGVFIGTREEGGQGTNPTPNAARSYWDRARLEAPRVQPPRGRGARAALGQGLSPDPPLPWCL